MKSKWMALLTATFFIAFTSNVSGQSTEDLKSLRLKLVLADSVKLISHVQTKEFGIKIVPDWDIADTTMTLEKYLKEHPENYQNAPTYLINNQVNPEIIKEAVVLSDRQRNQLINILGIRETIEFDPSSKCSVPQHSIIIYKFGRQSYIDICFSCGHVYSSKDIVFTEQNMTRKKWSDLRMFFQSSGIKERLDFPRE